MAYQTFRRRRVTLIVTIAACLAVTGSSSSTTAQELLGYWQLEETDVDAEAVDSSGNGLGGIYEGDVDPDVEGAPGFGSGAYFDGFTAQVLIEDSEVFGELTSDFTVMAWINPDQFDSKNRVFGGNPVGGGWGWGTAGDSLEITTYGVKDFDQAVPLELDEWAHAAIVLNADNEADFYVNGEFVGTQTHPAEGNTTANDFYIGFSCCDAEHFSGLLDEVGVFSGTLTEEQIQNAMEFGVSNYNGVGVLGDFNDNGVLDAPDIDDLTGQSAGGQNDLTYDLNADSVVDSTDVNIWITDLFNSWVGDADLDAEFNSGDLVRVLASGAYETGAGSVWSSGDFDGDGVTTSSDLVAALAGGGYEAGPRAAVAAVPEPASIVLLAFAMLGCFTAGRGR